MAKLRELRKSLDSTKMPRVEIELAGISTDLTSLTSAVSAITADSDLRGGVFKVNGQTLTQSLTFLATESAYCAGPVTVPVGLSITIPTGSRVVIL